MMWFGAFLSFMSTWITPQWQLVKVLYQISGLCNMYIYCYHYVFLCLISFCWLCSVRSVLKFYYCCSVLTTSIAHHARWDNLTSKCSMANVEVDFNHVETKDEAADELSSLSSGCSIPVVHLSADVLDSGSLNLLTEETCQSSIFTELPVSVQSLLAFVFFFLFLSRI